MLDVEFSVNVWIFTCCMLTQEVLTFCPKGTPHHLHRPPNPSTPTVEQLKQDVNYLHREKGFIQTWTKSLVSQF